MVWFALIVLHAFILYCDVSVSSIGYVMFALVLFVSCILRLFYVLTSVLQLYMHLDY